MAHRENKTKTVDDQVIPYERHIYLFPEDVQCSNTHFNRVNSNDEFTLYVKHSTAYDNFWDEETTKPTDEELEGKDGKVVAKEMSELALAIWASKREMPFILIEMVLDGSIADHDAIKFDDTEEGRRLNMQKKLDEADKKRAQRTKDRMKQMQAKNSNKNG